MTHLKQALLLLFGGVGGRPFVALHGAMVVVLAQCTEKL